MIHTNTLIYRRSMELITLCKEHMTELPKGFAFLGDQIRRASSSVVLNFAEGNGKISHRDRRRYFSIAKGSVLEVAAAFGVGFQFGVIAQSANATAQDLCDHLAALLHHYR